MHGAIATTVAIETGSYVRCDKFLVGQVEGLEDVSLLTKKVLLVVSVEECVCMCVVVVSVCVVVSVVCVCGDECVYGGVWYVYESVNY